MSAKPDPARWDARIEGDRDPAIEYRRVIIWPDGYPTISIPQTKEGAEGSFQWACQYRDAISAGATVILQSRYVDGWEDERTEVLGDPAKRSLAQVEMF